METCRNIRKKLSAYQDRELMPTEMDVVENHLCSCEACNKQHVALLQTYKTLKNLPVIEPTPGFSRHVLEKATQRSEPSWTRIPGGIFRLFPAPAAMATLTVVGLLAGALLGNFLTARSFNTPQLSSTVSTEKVLTLASVQVFNATPPGSFADGYLKLATYMPEVRLEK